MRRHLELLDTRYQSQQRRLDRGLHRPYWSTADDASLVLWRVRGQLHPPCLNCLDQADDEAVLVLYNQGLHSHWPNDYGPCDRRGWRPATRVHRIQGESLHYLIVVFLVHFTG